MVPHRGCHGRDAGLEETFAQHKATFEVSLYQVEQFQRGAGCAFGEGLQVLFRVERAQLGQVQVFQQDAAQHGGVGRQAGAHPHRAAQRRGGSDLGHIDDVAAITHHEVAGLADGITQAGDDGLTQLGQLQRGQVFKTQAQDGQAEPVVVAGALDEAQALQRAEHAKHRRAWQIEPARQLRRPQRAAVAAEFAQQAQASFQRGHGVLFGTIIYVGVSHGQCLQSQQQPRDGPPQRVVGPGWHGQHRESGKKALPAWPPKPHTARVG